MIDLKKPLPQELIDLPESDFQMVQSEEIHDEKFQTKPIGFFKDAMIRLSKSAVAVTSFTIIVIIILSSLIVPNITGYGYRQQNIAAKDLPPRIPLLEDIGIADGTRVLKNRKKEALSDPKRYPGAHLLHQVKALTPEILEMAGGAGSWRGTGGMATKLSAARIAMAAGCDMVITNGKRMEDLYGIVEGKTIGTRFLAAGYEEESV